MRKAHILLILFLVTLVQGCVLTERDTSSPPSLPAEITEEKVSSGGLQTDAEGFEADDRKLIKRGSLNIEVAHYESASETVAAIAEEGGGFVSSSSSQVTETGRRRGSITLRVPESEFFNVLEALEGVGEVKSRSVSTEDVTEEFVDLEARLHNLERQEERLLEIFDRAESVEDILKVEEQLGRVRGEIERLTGRLRYLENRVSLSTVTVTLYEPEPITQSFGLRGSVREAFQAFINTTSDIIVFIGFLLPLAILLFALFMVYWAVRNRGK